MRPSIVASSLVMSFLTVTILLAQSLLGLDKLYHVKEATLDVSSQRLLAGRVLGELDAAANRHALRMMRFLLSTSEASEREIVGQLALNKAAIHSLIFDYEHSLPAGTDRRSWDAFRRNWAIFEPSVDEILKVKARAGVAEAFGMAESRRAVFLGVSDNLRAEEARNSAIAAREAEAAEHIYRQAQIEVIGFGALTIALTIGASLYFRSRIVLPMKRFRAAMRQIAEGRLDTPVPCAERSDEIGEMAGALVYFREKLREAARVQSERSEMDIANLRLISEAQEAERKALAEAQEVIAGIASGLEEKVDETSRHLAEREREIIWRLSLATEHRDNETGNHILRMGRISGVIAELLGLPEEDRRMIELAVQMHDIGKVGIPDHILFKPGAFTPEERKLMETHTMIGWNILKDSEAPLLRLAADAALSHHEKWDGTGYPSGLSGTDIPLIGRIAAIADVFDALMSERSYKKAWPVEAVLAYVREQSGRHFDPDCAAALLDNVDRILAIFRSCNAQMRKTA